MSGRDENVCYQAEVLQAQAVNLRDKGGALCDQDKVAKLPLEAYRTLQEGL